MRKYIRFIVYLCAFILTFFGYCNNVFASFKQFTHELNYEITSVKLTDNKITFQGWAFIDHLDNIGGRNLQIAISAVTDYGTSNEKSYTIIENEYGFLDLYLSRFAAGNIPKSYGNNTAERQATIEQRKYNAAMSNNNIYDDVCIEGVSSSTYAEKANLSSGISGGSTCLYYNLKFDISFELSTLAKVFGTGSNISFYISARLNKYSTSNGAWPYEASGNRDGSSAHQWRNDKNSSFTSKKYDEKFWKSLSIFVYRDRYNNSVTGTGVYSATFTNERSSNFTVTYNGPSPLSYRASNGSRKNASDYSVANINGLFLSIIKENNSGISGISSISELNSRVNGDNSNGSSFIVNDITSNGVCYKTYIGDTSRSSCVFTYDLKANDPNLDNYKYKYCGNIVVYPVKQSSWNVRVSAAWGVISGGTSLTIKLEPTAKDLYCKDVYRETSSASKTVSGNACPVSNIKYYQCSRTDVSSTIYYRNSSCSITVKAKVLVDEKGTLNIGNLLDASGNRLINGDNVTTVTAGTGFGIDTATTYLDEFSWSFGQVNANDGITPYYAYAASSGCGDNFNVDNAENRFSTSTNGFNKSLEQASYEAISKVIATKYKTKGAEFNEFVKSYDSNGKGPYSDSSYTDSSFGKFNQDSTFGTAITSQNKNGSSYGYNSTTYKNSVKYYSVLYKYSFNTAYINRYTSEVTYDSSVGGGNPETYTDGGKLKYIPLKYSYSESGGNISDKSKFPLKFSTNSASNLYLSSWDGFRWTFDGLCSVVVTKGLYDCPEGNCDDDDDGGDKLSLAYNYRTIDVDNPFPRAIEKSDYPENWRDWYCGSDDNCSSNSYNKNRISGTYNAYPDEPLYRISINSSNLSAIKRISYFYSKWEPSDDAGIVGNTGSSKFVNNYFDIKANNTSYCSLGVWDTTCDQ